jgi:threonine dehydrogenase-like Zn-dependent dehydrogenase
MGTIVNVSVPNPHVQEIDWMDILTRDITLRTGLAHPHGVPDALQLGVELGTQGVDLGAWVTHKFTLDEAQLALETAGYLTDERPVKTALVFQD